MKKLDKDDIELLKLLQQGDLCVPKITKIAHLLKLPTSTVHSTIKKLEDIGAIKKYQAIVDSKKVGNDLTLFCVIKTKYEEGYASKERMHEFGEKLARIPGVLEVHACSSDWDFLVKIKAKNTDDYHETTQDKILRLGCIDELKSFVVYHTSKESLDAEPKL